MIAMTTRSSTNVKPIRRSSLDIWGTSAIQEQIEESKNPTIIQPPLLHVKIIVAPLKTANLWRTISRLFQDSPWKHTSIVP
jgi:hypothetical protein